MPTQTLALIGAACLADGHPSSCTDPALGTVQEGGTSAVTVDSIAIADHGDTMHYDSHAHDYTSKEGCHAIQSHDLTPDQTPPITINGQPVMRVDDDDTTDPGSGGRAWVDDLGGQNAITHTY